jgi:hypothetical protein
MSRRRGIYNTGFCEVRVYETYPGEDQARSPNRWNQPQFRKPDTGRKLWISYLQWILGGLEVSRWSGAGRTARK